jgi:hypothetical protein
VFWPYIYRIENIRYSLGVKGFQRKDLNIIIVLQITNKSISRIAPPANIGSLIGGNWEGILQKEMAEQEAIRRKLPIIEEQMIIHLLC